MNGSELSGNQSPPKNPLATAGFGTVVAGIALVILNCFVTPLLTPASDFYRYGIGSFLVVLAIDLPLLLVLSAGIVFCHLGLRRSRRVAKRGERLATVGLAMGYLAAGALILVLLGTLIIGVLLLSALKADFS